MMKLKFSGLMIILIVIVIIVGGYFLYSKLINPITNLTISNDNQVISIDSGTQFKVTLTNPGDGGYIFDEPIYDSSILTLVSKKHISPTSGAAGDFGSDSWIFEAKSVGQSDLEIDISRPRESKPHQKDFKISIAVK